MDARTIQRSTSSIIVVLRNNLPWSLNDRQYGDKNSYCWTMWIYCVALSQAHCLPAWKAMWVDGWMNSVSGSHMLKVGFVFLNGSSFIQCSHGRYSGTSINSLHWGWSWSIVVMDCCDLQKVLESTTKRLFESILLMVYGLDGGKKENVWWFDLRLLPTFPVILIALHWRSIEASSP